MSRAIPHQPVGNPCLKCGKPEEDHEKPREWRPTHAPNGDPCLRCDYPASAHPSAQALANAAATRKVRRDAQKARGIYPRSVKVKPERYYTGVDGEGMTLCWNCKKLYHFGDPPCCEKRYIRHIYTYLAAVNEYGKLVSEAFNPNGLSHDECVRMLLRIPRNSINFGYMFSYDVTKIIEQMPAIDRYTLLRPDTRRGVKCHCGKSYYEPLKRCPACESEEGHSYIAKVRFNGVGYDFFNGALTVCDHWNSDKQDYNRKIKVWDVFRFFGTSFVEAMRDWTIFSPGEKPVHECGDCRHIFSTKEEICPKCGSKTFKWWTDELRSVAKMKGERGSFTIEGAKDVNDYCRRECYMLALGMRKVIDSHEKAGIKLTVFNGAGSSAGAMLNKFGVKAFKGPKLERPDLHHAIMSAFFGGRFEHSVIGLVDRHVYSRDIASAYPYAMTFHPCLACGTWRKVKGPRAWQRAQEARLAVCHFRVKGEPSAKKREGIPWMPLPFRDDDGSISFPTGCEGWVWRDEIAAAFQGWGDWVEVSEAFIYDTDCDHTPFAFLPTLYRERVRWGKEGPGKSLKLCINAGYGRTAQQKGKNPPYQSMVWAGNTTSMCRAQLLRAMLQAKDLWSILSVATDGICTTEDLELEAPRETGTSDLKKPLGVWESKDVPSGVFFIKPGLYYAIDTRLDDVRARGVGRKEVFEDRQKLIQAFLDWDRRDVKNYHVALHSQRFYGAKHTIHVQSYCNRCRVSWPGHMSAGCPNCGRLGDDMKIKHLLGEDGEALYGKWGPRETRIRFDPHPKREAVFGGDERSGRMRVRDQGGKVSTAYDKAKLSDMAEGLKDEQDFMSFQPDYVDVG